MKLNLNRELAILKKLTTQQLQWRFAELFGDGTPTRNRTWLTRRIIWRLQALEEGDLSERAKRRAEELANDADLRVTAPAPLPTEADDRANSDELKSRSSLPHARQHKRRPQLGVGGLLWRARLLARRRLSGLGHRFNRAVERLRNPVIAAN